MSKHILVLFVAVSTTMMLMSGCSAQTRGKDIDKISYVAGTFQTTEVQNFPIVYPATTKALADLDLSITKETTDAVSSRIIARDELDRKVKVNLDGTANGTTEIKIRYGAWGHEARSQAIYDQIIRNLQ
jgi:hypothetical protein